MHERAEHLKNNLKTYVESITEKSKSGMYNCPLCGSGTGHNGTGAFSISKDGQKWKCFSCNEGGDIFDLLGAVEGISDYKEQEKRLCALFGTGAERSRTEKKDVSKSKPLQSDNDYTAYYLQAHKAAGQTDYFQKRGISEDIISRFKLGYDTNTKRVIIPVTKNFYKARATDGAEPKYLIPKGARAALFNKKALEQEDKPVFIAEGEIDALSIISAGGEAVGLGSTSNINLLIEAVKEHKPKKPLIIALDNDETGKKGAEKLKNELETLDIIFYMANIYGEYKDANEAFCKSREAFTNAVTEAENAEKEKYKSRSNANYITAFINGIKESVNTPYIETGFKKLDEALDGGLYEGLYIVGAISSLGKTTLVTQITDQIAQKGRDVLIFSLEMARDDIMAKSISRHTIQNILQNGGDTRNAKTARGITTGKLWEKYSLEEKHIISNAISNYTRYAKHIYITEGIGNIGAEQIRRDVSDHVYYTGESPVVAVDYIQKLAPYSEKATDKQNMDKSVMELKRISRDFKIPVIVISSLNRLNYKTAVSMESFKESGEIEYSADVLIGFQLKGMSDKDFDMTEAQGKTPREVELVILKNRNGKAGIKTDFEYYSMFNYFKEV